MIGSFYRIRLESTESRRFHQPGLQFPMPGHILIGFIGCGINTPFRIRPPSLKDPQGSFHRFICQRSGKGNIPTNVSSCLSSWQIWLCGYLPSYLRTLTPPSLERCYIQNPAIALRPAQWQDPPSSTRLASQDASRLYRLASS